MGNPSRLSKSGKRLVAKLLCAAMLFSTVVTPMAFAAGEFHTTLEGLTPLGGQWRETDGGLYSEGSGDCFNISSTEASDFVLEAEATFGQTRGAASLIFYSRAQPSQGSLCANIDKNNNNARIFRFGNGGGDLCSAVSLPGDMAGKTSYTMRLEVAGGQLRYFVDDLLITAQDLTEQGGGDRLGLLTFDTQVTYQNVEHADLTGQELPALTGLTVNGLTMESAFESGRYTYESTIAYGSSQVSLTPQAAAGTTVEVFAVDTAGNRITGEEQNGAFTFPVSTSNVNFMIRATRDGKSLTYVIQGKYDADYRDEYRPQFHFSPYENWMNDPNGLVYDPSNGTYHMYYQWNPSGLNIANQVWGHAESTDMINWVEQEPAIIQDDGLGAIFSGSAVVDENNTSGLFTDNKPGESKLVAIFTHDGGDTSQGVEKQSLAYSKDHGHTWIKPSVEVEGFENPIIPNPGDQYGRDFRDPKVFWYDGQWMMVIAGGAARLFTSPDLIHWEHAGDLGFNSECPDLFPLPVDGDENNVKWVYLASGRWYKVGELQRGDVVNGVQQYKFVAETGEIPYNGGPRVYATQSFYNDGSGQNRRMLVSWIQDYSAPQLEGKNWNGVQTVPYVASLKTVNGQPRLFTYPVEEVENNRTDTLVSITNREIDENSPNLLSGYGARMFDLEAVFTPGDATEFGFRLRKGAGQEIVVKYDAASHKFILDQNKSGEINTGIYSMDMVPTEDGKIKMRILVDTTVLEAFGNDGEASNTVMYFPESTSIGMELFTNGSLTVDSLNIYGMKSIWHEDEAQEQDMQLLASDEMTLEVGGKTTIGAAILPAPEGQKVTFTVEDNGVLESEAADDYSLNVTALKSGSAKVTATLDGTNITRETTVTVVDEFFKTNLSGFNFLSGNWYEGEGGLITDGESGRDVFAVSGQTAGVIQSYEADVTGNCASLLFAVTNPTSPGNGTWFGANVDTSGTEVVAKLFQNTNGGEVWNARLNIPRADSYHLKVTVSEDNIITYYVNDTLIGQHTADAYRSGYVGLLSYNGRATFNNVYLQTPETPEAADKTDLQKLYDQHAGKESWQYTEETWSAFESALTAAKEVLDNDSATQQQVDDAAAALTQAAEDLHEIPQGDVTLDGTVDEADIAKMKDFIFEKASPSERQLKAGDPDGDGKITVGDILKVRRIIEMGNFKQQVSYEDVVNRMVDLKSLSQAAPTGEACGESTSYEKLSRYNEETGVYENWDANADNGHDTPRTEDGGYLAADLTGPGALVRIWSAEPRQGHIKIYIDGETEPTVDMPFADLFGTGEAPFNLSALCYDASRGKNCYVPITFNESCRVVFYGDWGMYYHIGHIKFAENTQVEPFSMPVSEGQLAALQRVNDYFTDGLGEAPTHYEGETTTQKTVTVPAGGSVNLLDVQGSGAVTGITVKLNGMEDPGDDWDALAAMTLSAHWDGEESPAVWSTLGGFFGSITGTNEYASLPLGVKEDGTMYCYWYMPYENGAVLTIGNDGSRDYEIEYSVTTAPLSQEEAAGSLRFHAKWNRLTDPEKTDRWPDAQFLSTSGTGRFVGTSLHIYKEIGMSDPDYGSDWWWGEGDEKFFIDGEKFPSWFGTGSEDYFGYAWGSWMPFTAAYHSQPFTNGGMFGVGNRLNNRFHILDSVPFEESFEGYFEKYHRDGYSNWVFTNFWYLEPEGTDPYGPVSLEERTSYYSDPYPEAASFIEGEDLSIIESTGMLKAETQEMSPFPADTWSGGSQFIFKSANIGDYVKFWINIPEQGDYKFTVRLTKAGDYGAFQHYMDDTALGETIDLYDPTVCRTDEIELGTMTLSPGLHELKVQVSGKNTLSSGYFYGMDYLKVEKQ